MIKKYLDVNIHILSHKIDPSKISKVKKNSMYKKNINGYKVIAGRKWYYRLKEHEESNFEISGSKSISKSLLGENSKIITKKNLIVQWEYSALTRKKSKNQRLFGLFDDYIDFGNFIFKLPKKDWCFYECIFEGPQLAKFDIDASIDEYPNLNFGDVISELVKSILKVSEEYNLGIKINEIILFVSHGPKKQSGHLIIKNHYCVNNKESKKFYELVVNMMTKYEYVIDPKPYNRIQMWRIIECSKRNANRPKKHVKRWTYNNQTIYSKYPDRPMNENHKLMMKLELSLVSNIKGCVPFPRLIDDLDTDDVLYTTSMQDYDDIKLMEDDVNKIMEMLGEKIGKSVGDSRFPFKIRSVQGSMIVLNRRQLGKKSRFICPACGRTHKNENAFLYVVGRERKIYYNCRRSSGNAKKIIIGELGLSDEDCLVKIELDQEDDDFKDLVSSLISEIPTGPPPPYSEIDPEIPDDFKDVPSAPIKKPSKQTKKVIEYLTKSHQLHQMSNSDVKKAMIDLARSEKKGKQIKKINNIVSDASIEKLMGYV